MSQRARRRHRRSRGAVGKKVLLAFGVILAAAGIAAGSVGLWVQDIRASAPSLDELKPIQRGQVSEILAADGSRLGYIQSDAIREPIDGEEIPDSLRQATIAIERKIIEAELAQELEQERSKDWILSEYLNTASYGTNDGRTAVGVEAASQVYFNKHVSDLNLEEAALLAGVPQAPSEYNPFLNPEAAKARRNSVLTKMYEQGYIDAL